ncbi:hypothetical protein [Kribbella shirazensis]|jgi:hypothetical protein|uniref:Uncharacterized protein n=1 Tax=Kribbella shirazensis TaxID=1105143 RepID=A0A7X5ZZ28_9ACTN|nr:hypothetical protein [Kribbella shirazensis]NIK55776.1 hypothetical protein [Kribbella shirazensis]
MITNHEEVARFRVAERVRAAEERALYNEGRTRGGARKGVAGALRRLADKLEPARLAEPAARALTEPKPRHRGTGLSIVR